MAKPDLFPMGTIAPVTFQKYERYLPTAFDESLSLLEKVNKIIHYMNEIGEITNDMINRWNEVYTWVMGEGLEGAVTAKLEEWLADGTLSDIINEVLLGNKQDFIYMPVVDVVEYQRRNPSLTFTQAFQAVLDMAKPANRGMVHAVIPSGTHQLTAELVVYSNTIIESAEGVVFERYHNGYMLMNGERGASYTGYNGQGNIQIIGGTWDGRCTQVSDTGSNFAFAHGHRIIIKDCIIKDANSHHIEINSSKDVLIDNCQLIGLKTGLNYVESIQLDLASTSSGFPAFGAYDNTTCKDIEVRDCYFGPSGTSGTSSVSRGFGSHATRIGVYHEDIRFLNNTIDSATDYCVQFLSYQNAYVHGNTFKNCVGGVIMYAPQTSNVNHMIDINGNVTTNSQPVENIKITDNIFQNIQDKATVYLYGDTNGGTIKNIQVRGNSIDSSTDDVSGCFVFRYTECVNVSDNYFYDIHTYPISFNVSNKDFTVTNNRVTECFSSGIRVQDDAQCFTISHNEFIKNGRHGIEIFGDGVQYFNVSNNMICGANGRGLGSHGIYIHSSVGTLSVMGNIIRTHTGYTYENGMYITNTVTNFVKGGNVVVKGTGEAIVAVSAKDMGDLITGASSLTNATA